MEPEAEVYVVRTVFVTRAQSHWPALVTYFLYVYVMMCHM